jgi:hypothetical protein
MPERGSLAVHFSDAATRSEAKTVFSGDPGPGKRTVNDAVSNLAKAILLETPWLALLVVPAIGAAIVALLTWTTPAGDLPRNDSVGLRVSDTQWGVVRLLALGGALFLGLVAITCIVAAVFFPVARLVDIADAVRDQE